MIVYEKYRRKFGLLHVQLLELRGHMEHFSAVRQAQGKVAHADLLTQEASA